MKNNRFNKINKRLERVQEALGRIECRQVRQFHKTGKHDLSNCEFRVFSQWGEDGIIQYLINTVKIERDVFVEFGVENYTESNTRFLLVNNNWSGLVIDGDEDNIDYIRNDEIYWRYNLKAVCAFVTRENINDLLLSNGISGNIGLLSIDIDGNDYWVLEAIDCISPSIIICEYNSLFGTNKVTIPYDENFARSKAHFSNLYYGASISALTSLGKKKGYSLVGSNSAGNNLFFVRSDLIGELPTYSAQEAYRKAQFRESRDSNGKLTFLDFDQRINQISDMELYDLSSGHLIKVRDMDKA